MDVVLASNEWKGTIVYTDDVIIIFKFLKEHMKHIEEVLGLLIAAEMAPKLKYCYFFSKSFDHIGIVIATNKLQVLESTAGVVESLRYFKDISDMRFYL